MQAAIYRNPYESLSVEERDIPVIGQREVLIKVRVCAICNSDLSYIDRGMAPQAAPPLILGHELSGEIADLGDRVQDLSIGDRVILPATLSCGNCEGCRRNDESSCENLVYLGSGVDGGFAQYIAVDAKHVRVLPDWAGYELGSVISNLFLGAYHLVFERSRIQDGDKVVIFGSGAFGLSILQMAHLRHADVYMVDLFDWKLEIAKKYSAAGVLNSNRASVCEDALKELLGDRADVIIDTVGAPRTLIQGMRVLKKGGHHIMAANSDNQIPFLLSQILLNEMTISGVLSAPIHCYENVIHLLEKKKLQWEELITQKYSLKDINRGINHLRLGQSLRTLIYPWDSPEDN